MEWRADMSVELIDAAAGVVRGGAPMQMASPAQRGETAR